MSFLSESKPFSNEQLGALEESLGPAVVTWAIGNPSVRPSGNNHQLVRDLAALQAVSRATLAETRLANYDFSTVIGEDPDELTSTLGSYSPKGKAGTAAGQLAIAKLITTWYGLDAADMSRHRMPSGPMEYMELVIPEVEQAVCLNPQTLGITTFNFRDVYFEARDEAITAIENNGPGALAPFIDFPEFPIR